MAHGGLRFLVDLMSGLCGALFSIAKDERRSLLEDGHLVVKRF